MSRLPLPRLPRAGAALLLVIALAGLQGGCAGLQAERIRFVEGWRPGRIVQIDRGADMNVRTARDCRKEVAPDAAARELYALVRYNEAPSRYAYRIAPLSDAGSASVGDRVQVNIRYCHVPLPSAGN